MHDWPISAGLREWIVSAISIDERLRIVKFQESGNMLKSLQKIYRETMTGNTYPTEMSFQPQARPRQHSGVREDPSHKQSRVGAGSSQIAIWEYRPGRDSVGRGDSPIEGAWPRQKTREIVSSRREAIRMEFASKTRCWRWDSVHEWRPQRKLVNDERK